MRKAAEDYHRERKGNCAQSVAHAWMDKNPGGGTSVEGFAGCGAGKAPGGLCGAVHASCELAGAEAAETIRREFAEKSGGHLKCREIRAAKAMSCNACVGLAAELLEKHGPMKRDA
ncbi:MAG: hypothetical protein PHC30_07085 [Lentisphaeria bacterium]|jgi:hypothetical protein|nr:hypothetical protein [Lentisphaeria bacterium]